MLTTEEFAQKTGVTVEKVEYWENIGFIMPAGRTPEGKPLYTNSLADRCIQSMRTSYKGGRSVR